MNEIPIDKNHRERIEMPSLWQQNHGNLLLAFLACIVLIGGSILAYRQNRFVKPRFPGPSAFQQPPQAAAGGASASLDNSVVIRVLGAANDSGVVQVAIYDSAENYGNSDRAFLKRSLACSDGQAIWVIQQASLPDRFAVASFHDENGDDELNLNRFGIPAERYGFSQDARGLTGAPSFESAAIERPDPGSEIEITIR